MKLVDPRLAAYNSSSNTAAERTSEELSSLSKRRDPDAIDRAARQFEAYFVQYMLKEMRKTIPHSGMLGDRHTMEILESMMDENLGKSVAEGKGIGLAAQLRRLMGGDEEGEDALSAAHLPVSPAAPAMTGYPGSQAYQRLQRTLEELGDGPSQVTSGFGERIHPISGEPDFHAGVDIAMAEGTPVYAAAPGTVVFAGEQRGYGQLVIIEHADGYTTRYAHNSKLLVEAGQQVSARTWIAESGSTGNSTGPHLHFEVRRNGVAIDPRQARWARLP